MTTALHIEEEGKEEEGLVVGVVAVVVAVVAMVRVVMVVVAAMGVVAVAVEGWTVAGAER